MRGILIAASLAALTGTANATSEYGYVLSASERESIIVIGCPECVAREKAAEREANKLEPGTERHELKEVGGEMKLFTTEAWLGGSPVTIVRKATDVDIAKYSDEPAKAVPAKMADAPEQQPVKPVVAGMVGVPETAIDTEAKTSALPEEAKPFDPSTFELRTALD